MSAAECPSGLLIPGDRPALDVHRGDDCGRSDAPHPGIDSVPCSLLSRRTPASATGRPGACAALRISARDGCRGDAGVSGPSACEQGPSPCRMDGFSPSTTSFQAPRRTRGPRRGRSARAVMPSPQDKAHGPTRLHPTTGDSTRPRSRRTPFESASYHPTSVFRRTPEPVGPGSEKHRGCGGRVLTPACDGQASPETLDVPRSRISPRCRLRIPRAGRAGDPGPCPAACRLVLPDDQPAHHLDGPRDCALGDRPTGRDLGVAGSCLAGLAKPARETSVAPGGGVGLGLGGNGPGHALAPRPTPRHSRSPPGGGGRLGAGPRFSTLARDGSPDSRLASPLLPGRGDRDPGTAGLPVCPVECGRPHAGAGRVPTRRRLSPICSGSSWTPFVQIT